jgi:putative ABC transport system ATP-binding protein
VPVPDIDSLQIDKGQRVFIDGPSGSCKSKLLGLLTGIMTPQTGRAHVLKQSLNVMNGAAGDRLRADYMGIIFQMFNLIPYLTVTENVTLPCRFSHHRLERAGRNGGVVAETLRLLSRLGMIDPALLIVDGNPHEVLTVLRDYRKNLKLIMQDGKILKNTLVTAGDPHYRTIISPIVAD